MMGDSRSSTLPWALGILHTREPTLGAPPRENPEKIPERRFLPLTDTTTAVVSHDRGTGIIAIEGVCRLHLLLGLYTRRKSEELE
jgi:hypothetical protein